MQVSLSPNIQILQRLHVGADAIQSLQLVVSQMQDSQALQLVEALQTLNDIVGLESVKIKLKSCTQKLHILKLLNCTVVPYKVDADWANTGHLWSPNDFLSVQA